MKNKKYKILLIFGTRPEVIKMAPIIKELKKHLSLLDCKVCVSGQHRQMVDPLFKLFNLKVDFDLKIMRENQNLEHITTTVLLKVSKIIEKEKPDYLIVQGDTTTAMAATLAAFYQRTKVAHVEAGLRTWDKYHPFPEEINRKIIDSASDLYFAHTQNAKQNLINEGVKSEKIEVTGNSVIDALLDISKRRFNFNDTVLEKFDANKRKVILVTAHRRENFGKPIMNICMAIKRIALDFSDKVCFVYPVHLNPYIQKPVYAILGNIENVLLTAPLDYLSLVHLMKKSHFILTDSGGMQEEAPSLGKPVLVLRKTTERPEGVKAGCVEVIGTETRQIISTVRKLLENKVKYRKMSRASNPYGDGSASKRIVNRLLKELKKDG